MRPARNNEPPIVVLHNIRSIHNVGSIFRSANAAGVREIIVSGYTPTPIDRFGFPRRDFDKVALGAEKTVQWRQLKTIRHVLRLLREQKRQVIVVEQDPRSISLFKTQLPRNPFALIFGNEVRGLSIAVRDAADRIIEIPMHGSKESLNVSVAAGIVLFTILKLQKIK